MKTPLIGITCGTSDENPNRYEAPSDYATSIERAGGLPLLLPYRVSQAAVAQYIDLLDGILFSGGNDLDPKLYGETYHPSAIPVDPGRQQFELALLAEAERRQTPILGICLGSQLMNVHRGGSLIQFLPEQERPGKLEHRKLETALRHDVNILPGTVLADAVGRNQLSVNTRHKQAVRRIGRGLRVNAMSPDGVIEGVEDPDLPLFLAVQWHPENLSIEPEHLALFRLLVEKATAITWTVMPAISRRILLLITDLQIGGTPAVVRELAIRLAALPHVTVEVACLAGWGPVADQLQNEQIRVTALGAQGTAALPRVLFRLVRLIRESRSDLVFSFLVHANALASAASLFCRHTRFLQSIQTTQPEPRWHWRLQELLALAADGIVVPSRSVARAAERWAGVPPALVRVIPNAVDPSEFEHSVVPDHDPRPYPIGFIGRLDPIKRIPDLLAAVKALDGLVELHVFGEGRERPVVEAEIMRLGIARLVRLHGAVAKPHEALRQIGLLVLPSAAEGFGLVLIEAMAARVPVVATAVAGISDVVRDGGTGLLVPPFQPAALSAAIRRVVIDRALRSALISRGFDDVQQRFTWSQVFGQYKTLLGLES